MQAVKKIAALTAGATGAQAAFPFQLGPSLGCAVQVQFGGTGSVTLEGRASPDAPWVTLQLELGTPAAATVTEATDGVLLAILRAAPEMRANVTANSTTCDVWVMA